jgi:hypothetical protein
MLESVGEAIARFNAALEAFNAWNQGYREVWLELIGAARQMRACGISLPAMPGEQMAPPAPNVPVDVDAELRAAIKTTGVVDVAGAPIRATAPPVTTSASTPKTTKD